MWQVVTKSRFAVFLLVVFIVGGGSFFISRLSTRTTSLEHVAEGNKEILEKLSSSALDFYSIISALEKAVLGHDIIIAELSKTTVTLGKIVEGHYKTILRNTTEMQKDMKDLRIDMLEQTSGVQVDIDQLRSDVRNLITVISALAPSDPNE